jgi:hypothetical protein
MLPSCLFSAQFSYEKRMIDEYAPEDGVDKSALHDVALIESIVQTSAREGRWMSYSELLLSLGFRFSRPKMRAVCKTLAEVDRRAAAQGQPELAVLVVREGDGLPGQGWWTGRTDYVGLWTGIEATAFIRAVQSKAFAYWKNP